MNINWERVIFGLPTLIFCFALILLDAYGIIDIYKFGYAVVGSWVSLLINFYYRKERKSNEKNKAKTDPAK